MSSDAQPLEVPLATAVGADVEQSVEDTRTLRPLTTVSFGAPRPALLELPYTAGADPEVEVDVRALLEQISSAVVAELQPAAIIVRGSLGRGEGAALRVGRETHVTSDIELIAVYDGRAAMLRAWRARRRTAALRDTLADTLALPQLDLVTLPAGVLRAPPPSLAAFELVRSARLLSGTAELCRPAELPLERVPPADMMRRLRLAGNGLLLAWSRLGVESGELSETAARVIRSATDAVFLACGDTWLFRTGNYDHRLAVRAEWLRLPFAAGPGLTERLREEYQLAAREWLFPSARAGLSRHQAVGRWERAAVEWMGCFRAATQRAWWRRYGLGLRAAGVHPVRRRLEHMLEPAAQREDGPLSHRVQRAVLPLLIEWALDGWDDPARRERVASSLGIRRDEANELSYLILKYLSGLRLSPAPRVAPLRALPALSSS